MAKILIVDDSMTIRKVLRMMLQNEGHEFIEAVDGIEGLSKFEQTPGIQLVLTDVNMPNMDGLTMCERLRQTEIGKDVTIFVISTEGNTELKLRAKAAGVSGWMTKPPQADKLIGAVQISLKNKASGQ
ncbi:MAG: response regulator [Bdellovibrio sp.]|nr:response regulator [Bdellovibrio sp.]